MRTRPPVLVLAATAIAVLATLTFAAAPPAEVVLDDAVAKQGPVKFSHAKHVEVGGACTTCHHTSEGLAAGSDTKVELCTACHLDAKEGVPSMREMSMSKNPFHDACIACHKEKVKGPTKCTECHQPKAK